MINTVNCDNGNFFYSFSLFVHYENSSFAKTIQSHHKHHSIEQVTDIKTLLDITGTKISHSQVARSGGITISNLFFPLNVEVEVLRTFKINCEHFITIGSLNMKIGEWLIVVQK